MNLKNLVNTYSVYFKLVFIQNYGFNTKNEMKLNMNMDSLRFFRLNMNCNSTIQSNLASKPWYTLKVDVGVATNSTLVPHEVLAKLACEG